MLVTHKGVMGSLTRNGNDAFGLFGMARDGDKPISLLELNRDQYNDATLPFRMGIRGNRNDMEGDGRFDLQAHWHPEAVHHDHGKTVVDTGRAAVAALGALHH